MFIKESIIYACVLCKFFFKTNYKFIQSYLKTLAHLLTAAVVNDKRFPILYLFKNNRLAAVFSSVWRKREYVMTFIHSFYTWPTVVNLFRQRFSIILNIARTLYTVFVNKNQQAWKIRIEFTTVTNHNLSQRKIDYYTKC